MSEELCGCGSFEHMRRRTLLKAAGASGLAWLTPVAYALGQQEEKASKREPAKSVILLWMQGAPSQLETFDPHVGTKIGGQTKAIKTAAKDVQIGSGLAQVAELMSDIAIVRNVVSKEGDHERATYTVKTGYRPDPTMVHPSIGAIACHELPVGQAEIPRHVSIYPGPWPGRGGYLGGEYDAFKVYDPQRPLTDVSRRVSEERFDKRLADLDVVENNFARGRLKKLEDEKTLHRRSIAAAQKMMTSDQLKAFDVSTEPKALQEEFGDTPFGRGCLSAVRLIECGVRCVEVTLGSWDTHTNNHQQQHDLIKSLDPAFAALIRELKRRDRFDSTVVIWGGEFGRTPTINPLDGRDHWPHGFSIALAGGGIRGGVALGETDPAGEKLTFPDYDANDKSKYTRPEENTRVSDIHATVLEALAIDYSKEIITPIQRPMKLSDGKVVQRLLEAS